MSTQVNLDETNWVQIKDVSELRRGDRKAVNAAVRMEIDPDTKRPIISGAMEDDIYDATARMSVLNWSLQLPLPAADPSSLDKLTLEQDDNLRKALTPLMDALQGREAPVKDNEAPTDASAS